ncbi:unnamed protein product [Staurois parvus]|uniref:Insertion element IS150 protein InsJ-like helix-turn-helix domain-containing protein n=1 Tax=Staurois parvus TaxID=386267 RepID=A0ABN9HMP9_9NEOB|nr:unnamed protein product [Staurois parvus]
MQTASTNICERMGHSQDLSEKNGTLIGCHLCNKSIREISLLLNISWSTVSGIITKWKQLGTAATQPRSGRPRKMTVWGQSVLKRIVHRSHQLSAESITKLHVAFRLAQQQCIESFMEWVSMAKQLHPSLTSPLQCKALDAVV